MGYLNPFATGRGYELKVQLARASIAAMDELLAIDARARFVHCEPAIAIHPPPGSSPDEAECCNDAQFEAFDLIAGRLRPDIGGRPGLLDIVGLNYYDRNQWYLGGGTISRHDAGYRPLSDILHQAHARYGRPVTIAETGTEADGRADWFGYVVGETLRARRRGVPVEGLCLYPIVNHRGWDDDRICPNGLSAMLRPLLDGTSVRHWQRLWPRRSGSGFWRIPSVRNKQGTPTVVVPAHHWA